MATTGFVPKSVPVDALVDGCVVITSWLGVPATSVKVPRLVVPAVTPLIAEVPLFVIFPEAKGVPAEGRTRIFCQVSEFNARFSVTAVTVNVICVVLILEIATTVPLVLLLTLFPPAPLPPPSQVISTVGAIPPVSKINPDGAFNIMVPVPISAVTPSEITGPVNEVYVPPVVSAEIADPPVEGVTVTAAFAIKAVIPNTSRVAITIFAEMRREWPMHNIILLESCGC